ncbi:RNA polymerase sigma-70 factor (ECF subfamily) [Bacillus pakistanensis]|uniref:RNA polymerase sigma-70 factor (ECF subfamily) n=1 Tax=Rossellomorea pakistanensis TaxID=992288 RepID=A0ABS2NDU4_9BACI|nr:RNA polymerase sigma-70 factor (ECF subfamily) [Bacillus pakistanensis]
MNGPDQLKELNTEMNFVYRYLRKLGISHEDSQDVVQETAYKFLMYYDSIKTKKIRSWLIRVALNFHHDQYRKNKRIQLGFQDEQIILQSKELPEDVLISNEKWSDIERVLNKLKPQYKELILLKYLNDCRQRDEPLGEWSTHQSDKLYLTAHRLTFQRITQIHSNNPSLYLIVVL